MTAVKKNYPHVIVYRSAIMSSSILFDEKVESTLNNLLNKAGRDPRLTPRLLREKTEQKLSIPKGKIYSQYNNNY